MAVLGYREPLYQTLIKKEEFDDQDIKAIISDPHFDKSDRDKLVKYFKHRSNNGEILVNYMFGEGCELKQIGRLYPRFGMGLQGFRKEIRNAIVESFYWEIDIENCHYNIARKLCKQYDIECPRIERYCAHRNEVLAEISDDSKYAKTLLLRLMYGGEIELYCPHYEEHIGQTKESADVFMRDMERELKLLRNQLYEEYSEWTNFSIGSEKKKIKDRRNPHVSLMAMVFQTEERKLLMYLDYVLCQQNRYMGIFCHDGGFIRKLLGEDTFPHALLDYCSTELTLFYGSKIYVRQKSIVVTHRSPHTARRREVRSTMIDAFTKEYKYSKNKGLFCKIGNDGSVTYLTTQVVKFNTANMQWMDIDDMTGKPVRKTAMAEWLISPDRVDYDDIRFIPDKAVAPTSGKIFNLFTGFQARHCEPDEPMSFDEIHQRCEMLVYHANTLTQGYADYLFKWMSHILQYPGIRSDVSILLRDIPGTLVKSGGVGKNMFIEWFGNKILGSRYFYVVSNNEELYRQFNSQLSNKLLIFVEEAAGRVNHANKDALKAGITSSQRTVERKHCEATVEPEFSRIMFATNNRYILPGDRRFAMFDCNPKHKGDVEYFTNLYNHMYDEKTIWAFYQYLLQYETYSEKMLFQTNIPVNEAFRDMTYASTDIVTKYVLYLVENGIVEDKGVHESYIEFTTFYDEKKKQSPDLPAHISEKEFSRSLFAMQTIGSANPICNKRKTSKGMIVEWNIDFLVKTLKEWNLIDVDFRYTPQNPELIRRSRLFAPNFNPPTDS